MIGKIIKYRLQDIYKVLLIELGGFIFGTILMWIVLAVDSENTSFEIGTTVAAFAILFLTLFMVGMGLQSEFNMMVGMGVIRREFIVGYFVSSFIGVVIEYLILIPLHFIESAEISFFYGDLEKEPALEGILFSWYIVPILLFIVTLGMFVGVLVMKVGKKAMIGVWVLWMLICLLPSKVEEAMENESENMFSAIGEGFNYIANKTSPMICVIAGILISLVLFLFSINVLRKQRVTL